MNILATADWHTGPYKHPKRCDDFLAAIDQIIEFAAEYKPDLILHGGDVFRSNRPGGEHRREAARRVKALSDIAPTILIPGNHDIMASGSAIDAWKELAPENLYVATQPEVIRLPFCNVIAMPWMTSRHLAEFGKSIVQQTQELGSAIRLLLQLIVANLDNKPRVLLAHASAVAGRMGNYRPEVLGKDLVWPEEWFEPFDLAVLGHFHNAQVLGNALYPGSPERVTFNEKDEAKGFYTLELGSEPVFHEIQTRPMIQLEGTPAEITASLKDVPDEAILKIRVHLELGEPKFELSSRWFELIVEEIRPKQERETRLEGFKVSQLEPMEILEIWLGTRGHSEEKIATLLSYAEDLERERQNDN